ncbi:MAG: hypothetical protein WBC74_00020 [Candidatus Omnitrophota bacterium]
MAKKPLIRIWQEADIQSIEPHLLIAGATAGSCASCKEMGIPFDAKNCPKCGTLFRYIGTRISNSIKEAKRLRAKRPDLILIEFQDFKDAQTRSSAHDFLDGIL